MIPPSEIPHCAGMFRDRSAHARTAMGSVPGGWRCPTCHLFLNEAEDDEVTSLEMLADYECPECGPMADLDLTEDEATAVFGGDEHGNMRCPTDWCDGEELELTADAAAANLAWLAERFGGGMRS